MTILIANSVCLQVLNTVLCILCALSCLNIIMTLWNKYHKQNKDWDPGSSCTLAQVADLQFKFESVSLQQLCSDQCDVMCSNTCCSSYRIPWVKTRPFNITDFRLGHTADFSKWVLEIDMSPNGRFMRHHMVPHLLNSPLFSVAVSLVGLSHSVVFRRCQHRSGLLDSEVKSLSRVRLFATPWTIAYQASQSMGFSRQQYWSGCHFLLQGIFPTQGSNPGLPHRGRHFTLWAQWWSLSPWDFLSHIFPYEKAKALDCVDHNKLWKILKEMGIPDHLICLLRNLYAGQEAIVRTEHGTTDWFQTCNYMLLAATEICRLLLD